MVNRGPVLFKLEMAGLIKTPELSPEQAEKLAAAWAPWADALDAATTVPASADASREVYLARLAARYVVLCAESGTPTKVLAKELCISVATVRDQLGEARYKLLLTHPGSGRAGGELTQKAIDLLTEAEA